MDIELARDIASQAIAICAGLADLGTDVRLAGQDKAALVIFKLSDELRHNPAVAFALGTVSGARRQQQISPESDKNTPAPQKQV
ncbi:hypothetical protein ES703_118354 [subsurface metagenome]